MVHAKVEYLGAIPIVAGVSEPPNDYDCRDSIKFMKKAWRKTDKYRNGIPMEAQVSVHEAKHEVHMTARTFAPAEIRKWKFVHGSDKIHGTWAHKRHLAFVTKFDRKDTNSPLGDKDRAQATHICYVFECPDEKSAIDIQEAIKNHVSETLLETLKKNEEMAKKFVGPKSVATLVNGNQENQMVDETAPWYFSVTREECKKMFKGPNVREGDFMVRESSGGNGFSLSVATIRRVELSVTHYRIQLMNNKCFLEGRKSDMFSSLQQLVLHYVRKGIGRVRLLHPINYGEFVMKQEGRLVRQPPSALVVPKPKSSGMHRTTTKVWAQKKDAEERQGASDASDYSSFDNEEEEEDYEDGEWPESL